MNDFVYPFLQITVHVFLATMSKKSKMITFFLLSKFVRAPKVAVFPGGSRREDLRAL